MAADGDPCPVPPCHLTLRIGQAPDEITHCGNLWKLRLSAWKHGASWPFHSADKFIYFRRCSMLFFSIPIFRLSGRGKPPATQRNLSEASRELGEGGGSSSRCVKHRDANADDNIKAGQHIRQCQRQQTTMATPMTANDNNYLNFGSKSSPTLGWHVPAYRGRGSCN
jgi:hypothetical protein